MKYLGGIIALICFLCSQSVFAQTDSSLAGRKALMFSFNGLNLGGGIGGKYWINSSVVVRAQIKGSCSDSKANELDPKDTWTYNWDVFDIQISPSIGIEKHFTVNEKLSPYFGCGFAYTFESRQMKYHYIDHDTYSVETTNTYSGNIFIGIEYWLNDVISLTGEQAISLSYDSGTNNPYKDFNIKNSTPSLMLSIYF